MLIMSNMGDHVWLMTSRQTDPELCVCQQRVLWLWKSSIHLIDIWMENSVDKAYAWAFVRVLIWKLYMHFPKATFEWCYRKQLISQYPESTKKLSPKPTFFGSLKSNVEFLPGDQRFVSHYPSRKCDIQCENFDVHYDLVSIYYTFMLRLRGSRTIIVDQSHLIITHQPALTY